ncbi:hypothetical protein M758_UG218300 [Ceratodon purpureus]|nr:hypothetical protein M758_UG218300 [Ceratodon purpureus]
MCILISLEISLGGFMGGTMFNHPRLVLALGQRHAQGSSCVDLTMEAIPNPEDPPYDLKKERILLEEMRRMLQNFLRGQLLASIFKKEGVCGGHRMLNDLIVIPWDMLQELIDGEKTA